MQQHAQVCAIVGCRGVDYKREVIKDILLSGIYNHNVCREVLGSSSVKDKSVNDLIRFVEAKEAAHNAAVGNRPAAAAAAASSSYKKSSRQDNGSRPQAATTSAEERPAEWPAPEEALMQ